MTFGLTVVDKHSEDILDTSEKEKEGERERSKTTVETFKLEMLWAIPSCVNDKSKKACNGEEAKQINPR